MRIITVDEKNIGSEHICCAITEKKGECCVSSKKDWMQQQFSSGLVFRKLNDRGKVFIEYIPAENAWVPLKHAKDYMFINCLWVSGKFKGHGYSTALLDQCIEDAKAKGKAGLIALSSSTQKKMPFLSDPNFLEYKGFQICDSAQPYFRLYYLPFQEVQTVPGLKKCCKEGNIQEDGFVLYYTNQCPFTAKYVPILEEMAKAHQIPLRIKKITTKEEAQNAPSPFTTYSLFYNGIFETNEILSGKKFLSIVEKYKEQ